jgi:hypothetical protein
MNADKTSFPVSWLSVELKGYRDWPEHNTYAVFPYESLPTLPAELFRGDFQWLTKSSPEAPPSESDHAYWQSEFSRIMTSASQMGLKLPEPFVKFMESSELRGRVRSATDCYFELPDQIAEYPSGERRYLISFLTDSQGSLFWYLYLWDTGEHCVVVSDLEFGSDWEEDEVVELGRAGERIFFCAPTFEAFIYRFWIENQIWFALDENKPLTEEQQIYVDHYRNMTPNDKPAAAS